MSADPGSGRRRGLKRRRLLQAGFAATAFGATGAGAAEDETAAAPEGFFQAHGRDPRIAVSESGRALLEVVKRFWERINGTVVATGSSNAYVYTTADKALPLAYAQGEAYSFKAGFSNTGGASLNVNGLGFKPLYKQSVDGPSELASGEIRRGQFLTVMYDSGLAGGGGGFQIVSQISDITISRFYATIAELKSVPAARVPANFVAHVAGYHAPGDGGGGQFWFDAASTAAEDGGLVIAPAANAPAGRWMRFVAGFRLSPKWFGAVADGKTPVGAQIQATLDAARGLYVVDIDDTYLVDATLILRHGGQVIAGQGTLVGAIAAFPRIAGNAPFAANDSYGEGSFAIKSLDAQGGEIAATTHFPHNFKSGDTVAVFFVLPDSYCGIQPVTVTGPQSFTYRVPEAPEGAARLYGALCSKIDHPPVTEANDPLAASGGACFRAAGNIDNVLVKDIRIKNFRYGALMSGPGVKDPATVDSVNMLTFERVTFEAVNICGFGYPFIQGGTFLDCIYYEVNCIACGNAACLPAGHPYAGTDTQFVVLLAIDNRGGLEHRLRVNANLDLWFYESVLRPETASINPQKTPTWFLPFRRGKGKMPPSQASVSGHGVYCPSRSAAQQYENTIRNFKTFCSYRSLVVMGQPSFLMMDCLGTETYIKPMPGEPTAHIILAYEDNGIFPLGRDGVLRRIENLEFQHPASKSVEIDRIRYDQSGFISRAGDASWLGGDPPHGLLSFDCETPNDCLVQWSGGTSMNQAFVVTPQALAATAAAKGASVVANAVHPLSTGVSELGVHRSSGSFLLGSTALGTNGNRLQLCGSSERATRGIMEILATRLDTGETDYCRLRFTLPPRLEVGPAGLGTLAAGLDVGNASVPIAPGSRSEAALRPGLAVEIGANRLVVERYDPKSRTLTFHTGARTRARSGTGISASGALKIVDRFASADIFEEPYLNGTAIELRTTLYPDGASAPTPIAVTFWLTDTLYFEGGGAVPR